LTTDIPLTLSTGHAAEATFDPPKCHPHTRIAVIDKGYGWISEHYQREEVREAVILYFLIKLLLASSLALKLRVVILIKITHRDNLGVRVCAGMNEEEDLPTVVL
jgi:hypothetical protein